VELGRGFRWKVMWSYVLPVGIGLALDAGGGGLFGWIRTFDPANTRWLFFCSAMTALWVLAVTLVFKPLGMIAMTLTYYDLCVRKEGLDVALMMEQAGMALDAPAVAPQGTDAVGEVWARTAYREPRAGEEPVGIPWSELAAKDAVAVEDGTAEDDEGADLAEGEQLA
jgi:hypothetical protein